jgi:sugar transferase (PEP-CTERM/EpsH1 system associated)
LSSRYRRLRKVCDPFVKSYIAVSRDIAGWLHKDIGISAAKISQIYNGVDTRKFKPGDAAVGLPFSMDEKPFVFGFVGRMDPVKGLDVLIDAFARLANRDPASSRPVRLVMVGEGSERDRCKALLGERGLTDLAWLPGRSDDIPGVLRALDAFILPSLNEGISNTILEAMATALPIVATAVGGNPELIEDGVHGLLVPARDADAMAQAMARCSDDPAYATGLGVAARKRVEAQFSLDTMAAQYGELYQYLQGPGQSGQKLRAA